MFGRRRDPFARFDRLERLGTARWHLEFEGYVLAWRLIGDEFDRERERLVPFPGRVVSDGPQNRIGVGIEPGPSQNDPLAGFEVRHIFVWLSPDEGRLLCDRATVCVVTYQFT